MTSTKPTHLPDCIPQNPERVNSCQFSYSSLSGKKKKKKKKLNYKLQHFWLYDHIHSHQCVSFSLWQVGLREIQLVNDCGDSSVRQITHSLLCFIFIPITSDSDKLFLYKYLHFCWDFTGKTQAQTYITYFFYPHFVVDGFCPPDSFLSDAEGLHLVRILIQNNASSCFWLKGVA